MAYNSAREKLNSDRIREPASWRNDGIDAPNLFRAWNDVGSNGLNEIERYARMEFRDGNWASLRGLIAPKNVRGGSLLGRVAAALHMGSAASKDAARAVRPSVTAVHFAGEPAANVEPCPTATSAILLVAAEDCGAHHVECRQ